MNRLMRGLRWTAVAAGLVAIAQLANAAGEVSCEVTKAGRKEIVKVATHAACTRMGGKVVAPERKK